MKQWAWRALAAAREEIHLAVESVMEDLEGLSAGCSGMPSDSLASDQHADQPAGTFFELSEPGAEQADDDDVLRVDDLVAPVPTRAEYEQELPETRADYGFEIIDWEEECQVLSFR
uniref:Uncharacterized protein n=2 Tax=Prymnesium polylepis TaxID=72548 RepID=A0A6V4W211_9EUKA|mmetsp:Transcript_37981/g.94750  ORF Transcript_37981/g.94750 Transcript_37981/m.94750 type:complete len:116 (+) Transcript_37981:377-724(+)